MNIQKNIPFGCHIEIHGDNNTVIFGRNCNFRGRISIGTYDCNAYNCKLIVGDNTTSNGMEMWIVDDGTEVSIGNDCMFSDEIQIWASDTHAIFDKDGNLSNAGSHITIGNHVWIGKHVVILKNTTIGNNSIVGFGSVVSGNFPDDNIVLAGNPAKIVKTEIGGWSRLRPNQYRQSIIYHTN